MNSNAKKRNSILAHTSPRIKRCAVVGDRVMLPSEKLANSSTQDSYNPNEVHRCSSSRCALCPKLKTGSTFRSSLTGREYQVVCNSHMSCDSRHVVYLISCKKCGFQYVGETSQLLRCRINQHRACIRRTNPTTLIAKHFASEGHSLEDLEIMPIENVSPRPQESQSNVDQRRRMREEFWIRELGTLDPYGLNDKIQSWGSLSQKSQGSLIVTYSLFNKHVHRPHSRHTTGKRRARARHRLFDPHSFLAEVSSSVSTEPCFLRDTRTRVFSLGQRSLGSLDTFLAGNITTDISQGQLRIVRDLVNFRLGLGHSQSKPGDDKSNPKSKVFLQVLFENKGIDEVGLSGILRSPDVVSTLPSDFTDKVPLVCYRYTPTIATKILNFKVESKVVNMSDRPAPCTCHNSPFVHRPLGHVVTGDLSIITDPKLRAIFEKGPKFREPRTVSWQKNFEIIKNAVHHCQEKWATRLRVPQVVLQEWVTTVLSKVRMKIDSLSRKGSQCVTKSVFSNKAVQQSLKDLHEKYVITTADKAGNNVVFICKNYYHEKIRNELGAQNETIGNSTYRVCSLSTDSIIKSHVDFCKKYKIDLTPAERSLPYLHWLPKLHKNPYGSRFIAASSRCSTTTISKILTACLGLIKQRQQGYYDAVYRNSGIQGYWIIKNSDEVSEVVSDVNRRGQVNSVKTYDFSTPIPICHTMNWKKESQD